MSIGLQALFLLRSRFVPRSKLFLYNQDKDEGRGKSTNFLPTSGRGIKAWKHMRSPRVLYKGYA